MTLDAATVSRTDGSNIPSDLAYCHDYFERLFHTNFFKCLSDVTRQKIILLVGATGPEGMRVGDIANHFSLDRTTVSHHLTMLREANLLQSQKRGKEIYCSVNIEYVAGALEKAASILRSCCK